RAGTWLKQEMSKTSDIGKRFLPERVRHSREHIEGADLRMDLAAGGDLQAVLDERHDGGKALLRSALAAGEIDDQCAPLQARYSTRQPCEGIALCAVKTHGLGQTGGLTIDDSACSFRGAVARTESGAAHGQNQGSTNAAPLGQQGGDCVFIVRHKGSRDFGLLPFLPQQLNHGRARCVDEQALRAAVGDGKDGKQHDAHSIRVLRRCNGYPAIIEEHVDCVQPYLYALWPAGYRKRGASQPVAVPALGVNVQLCLNFGVLE